MIGGVDLAPLSTSLYWHRLTVGDRLRLPFQRLAGIDHASALRCIDALRHSDAGDRTKNTGKSDTGDPKKR